MSLADGAPDPNITLLFGGSTVVEGLLIYSAYCMHLGCLKGLLFVLVTLTVYTGAFVFLMNDKELFNNPP
jgi:hypothetical protein